MDNISSYSGSRASASRSNRNETSRSSGGSALSRANRSVRSALSNTVNSLWRHSSRNSHRSNTNSEAQNFTRDELFSARSQARSLGLGATASLALTMASANRYSERITNERRSVSGESSTVTTPPNRDAGSTANTSSNRDTGNTRTSQSRASAAVTANDPFDQSRDSYDFMYEHHQDLYSTDRFDQSRNSYDFMYDHLRDLNSTGR